MIRWITVVDHAAEIAGDAAQDDAQHETQRHADQTDRHRRPRRVHEPRPEVASLHVGSQQEERLARLGSFHGDEMAVGRDEAQELVRLAPAEERDRYLLARVGNIDPLERQRVAGSCQRVHVGLEASLVEPVDLLRRHQRALRFRFQRIHIGEEVGEQRDQIESNQDDGSAGGELVLAEAPPHELPLRGDGDPVFRQDPGLPRAGACSAITAAPAVFSGRPTSAAGPK